MIDSIVETSSTVGVGRLLCEWIRVEAEGQVESSDMLICCIEGRYSVLRSTDTREERRESSDMKICCIEGRPSALRSTGTREVRRESSDMIICCIKGCYSVLRSTGTVACEHRA